MKSEVNLNINETVESVQNFLYQKVELEAYNKHCTAESIKFVPDKMIGRGGNGVVVRILYENGPYGALKKFKTRKEVRERELDFLLKLSHQNIANLNYFYYSENTNGTRFLNMCLEYCSFCLEDFTMKKLSPQFIKIIYLQLMCGLNYLHSKNICHGDIKPGNILIDDSGCVKICDFGSALNTKKRHSKEMVNGTLSYMAVEALKNPQAYSNKIDIWASACVIVELKSGSILFPGLTKTEVLSNIEKLLIFSDTKHAVRSESMLEKLLKSLFDDKHILDTVISSLNPNKSLRIPARKAIAKLSNLS